MSPKASLAGLFLFTLGLGVMRSDFSCGPVGKSKIQLSFWNGFTGPDGRIMLGMIRQFNEANPDVEISMQRMDWATYYNKLMVAAVDGRGPEVFVLQSSSLPRMERAGFVADVNDLYGGEGVDPNDFDPLVIGQVKYGNRYVGLPLDIWPFGLYCNADELKAAGFVDSAGNARAPKTREEFVKLARELRHDDDKDGKPDEWGYALTNWRMNYQSILPQFDGYYFDRNGKADLANPKNVAALNFLGSLSKEKSLIPPPENALGWVGFRQKKVAMVIDGIFMLGDLQRLNDFQYLGAPIPVVGSHPGTMAESHVLCVRKGLDANRQRAAERFIRFLSDHSIEWAGAGQVPARKSVRATPEFARLPVQSAFAEQIPYMAYLPRTPIIFELNLELDLAVEKVVRGRASAEEALKVANDHVQAFLDRDARERKVAE